MEDMPKSMDECIYFTNRKVEDTGKVIAWVTKPECPECGKGRMGKPVDEKTGKVKVRADYYVCPECGHEEKKADIEPTLSLEADYTCPYCGNKGHTTTEYKRKSFQGVKAYVFKCEKCGKKIPITKKLKEIKKKK
ncbi:hypothetical protein GF351_00790 [Candidatus Woesearchaeota archaeon]|nr:hypothetical protein [Candidatus Woesearchaeota archaeon]